jgi:hypothetical protein
LKKEGRKSQGVMGKIPKTTHFNEKSYEPARKKSDQSTVRSGETYLLEMDFNEAGKRGKER